MTALLPLLLHRKTKRGCDARPGDPAYGEQFLLYSPEDPESVNVIIFATASDLVCLNESNHLIGDGNFKYQPKKPFPFYQLYTMMGFIRGEAMPLVYALLPDKTEETYRFLFQAIRDSVLQGPGAVIQGGFMHLDFEMAAMNAAGNNSFGCLLLTTYMFITFCSLN